ncbi:hypothetical protein [Desulfogranum mediterraneum]|uniref:hypothetical protein n=1 Tax=Desulfogranum mediterraneum TaxID=160661 RepID=UPI00040CEA70|nr:hypothetical protein [Desulfogranum mediterraneum]
MSNMAAQAPLTAVPSRHNSLSDFQTSTYVREQSFRSDERLETGLVIQTKEGDQVTLNSSSFSQMDSFLYDSKGLVQTEAGTALFSQQQREISLASGHSFSFSVAGDLNEDELKDIEAILTGLDGVIAEMGQGDISGALDSALEMGGYDSVASFTADIHYQRSSELRSERTAATSQGQSIQEGPFREELPSPLPAEPGSQAQPPQGKNEGMPMDFAKLFHKMEQVLSHHGNSQLALAKNPMNKLFQHHLDQLGEEEEQGASTYAALESAMEEIGSLVEELAAKTFSEQLPAVEED